MVRVGGAKEQERSSSPSAAAAAAAVAKAARPPRPVRFKRIGMWHPLKYCRFRVVGTKTSLSAQAVAGAREMGEATTAAVATGASKESERPDDVGHICGAWKSEDGSLHCGYSSFRGRRLNMEDFYDIKSSKIDANHITLFGIFDGHGGSCAAEYLKEHLFENLLKHPAFITDTKLAISETYKKTDSDYLDAETSIHREDGSTASTAILVGNHLYVANVGDSRAVMSKAGIVEKQIIPVLDKYCGKICTIRWTGEAQHDREFSAIALSDDHKPNRSDEQKRIENAGGVVIWSGTWRVGGVLAMSRAFGDRLLKRFVVAEPEIQERAIDDEMDFLILASDGLWDVVSNEHAVAFVKDEDGPEAAARKLTDIAFARGSTDNITCIVVKFHRRKMDSSSSSSSGQT